MATGESRGGSGGADGGSTAAAGGTLGVAGSPGAAGPGFPGGGGGGGGGGAAAAGGRGGNDGGAAGLAGTNGQVSNGMAQGSDGGAGGVGGALQGGGGGGGGGNGLIFQEGGRSPSSRNNLFGGSGGAGGDATGGAGGGGGSGGYGLVRDVRIGGNGLSISGTVTGGAGGVGGSGGPNRPGGDGGDGGAGVYFKTGESIYATSSGATITGGKGGAGGSGGGALLSGRGGTGGAGITSLDVDSSIGLIQNFGATRGGDGGAGGGSGGAGVSGDGLRIFTAGSTGRVRGGNADNTGLAPGATPGVGGVGIIGQNLRVDIQNDNATDLVAGGFSNLDGTGTQADAIVFTGGTNDLSYSSGSVISGGISLSGSLNINGFDGLTSAIRDGANGPGSISAQNAALSGANTYSGGTSVTRLTLDAATTLNDDGSIRSAAAGTGAISFAPLSVTSTARLSLTLRAQPTNVTFANAITDARADSEIELAGLTNASVAYNSASSLLTVQGTSGGAGVVQTYKVSFASDVTGEKGFTAQATRDGGTLLTATVCFAAGTRLRTMLGEVAVEALRVGEAVVTGSGALRPIRWIGHRTVEARRHPEPRHVMPVRIAADAFGPSRPARDLLVSPAHAICVEAEGGEVLIPACRLINGTTITQVAVERVTYWHVELDSHDVLLAEGLPAESYLDCGNRHFFANAEVTGLHAVPDARPEDPLPFCRPFHEDGPAVAAVRGQLEARAKALGWSLAAAAPAELHLVADGRVIHPEMDGLSACFVVPATAREVRLVSATSAPAHVLAGSSDDRRLGVPVGGFVVEGRRGVQGKLVKARVVGGKARTRHFAIDDPRLKQGFHPLDRDAAGAVWRWTDGSALLPSDLWAGFRGEVRLHVALAGVALPRWIAPPRVASAVETGGVRRRG